jgi:hypothetical protein
MTTSVSVRWLWGTGKDDPALVHRGPDPLLTGGVKRLADVGNSIGAKDVDPEALLSSRVHGLLVGQPFVGCASWSV